MRLSELVVQSQCFEGGPTSLRVSFTAWFICELRGQRIRVSKSRVSQRIIRVELNGLLKIFHARHESVPCIFGKKVLSSYIQLIGIRVIRVSFRHATVDLACKPRSQLLSNGFRDFFLYKQRVREWAVVLLSPELRASAGIDEVRLDDQLIADLLHSPRQHAVDGELAPQAFIVELLPLVAKGGRPRDDPQLWYLRKAVDETVG